MSGLVFNWRLGMFFSSLAVLFFIQRVLAAGSQNWLGCRVYRDTSSSGKVSGKLRSANCVGFVGGVQFWLRQIFKVSIISLVKVLG